MNDEVSLRKPAPWLPGDRPALPSGDGRPSDDGVLPATAEVGPPEQSVFGLAAELKSIIREDRLRRSRRP